MKTDQFMTVSVGDLELDIYHLSMMGSLTQLWNFGNKGRSSFANMAKFLSSEKTAAFQVATAKLLGVAPESLVTVTGKGNTRQTFAHINMLVYAAEYLSPEFHAQVVDTFVRGKILYWRDCGGDEYKMLNAAIAQHLPSPSGDNKGRYINAAKMIRAKCGVKSGDVELATWNKADVRLEDFKRRYEVEAKLVSFINMGFIRDWDHLKDVIAKI